MSAGLMLIYTVPVASAAKVAAACFGAGAGQVGQYAQCCWSVVGQGQFRPLSGSNPAVGAVDTVTEVEEVRVEMMCMKADWPKVERALLAAHPYETPAYYVLALFNPLRIDDGSEAV